MASTPPKGNSKTDMAKTAASVAFPEVGMALAAKDAMDSKSKTPNTGSGGGSFHTTVSKENGDVIVNVNGGGSGGGSGGNNSKDKKYVSVDAKVGQQSAIFLFAILIHLIDGFVFGFARTGISLTTIIIAYGFLGIYLAWMYDGDGSQKKAVYMGIIVALALPMILAIPGVARATQAVTFVLALSGLLLLIPVVPIMAGMAFKENEGLRKWTARYVLVWIVIAFLVIMATYGSVSTQPSKALVKPWESIKFVTKGIGKSLASVEKSVMTSFKKAMAQATGQPYEGEEESRAGIYVDEVKPIESKYNTNTEVYVEAKIKALNVKEAVPSVNTICYIEGVRQGTVNPTMLYDISGNYDNIVSCNLGILPEGTYTVKVRANFEFESSSDIEYTFVNSKLKPDQYDSLNINSVSVATYTGGPVELGLPSLTQPLRINTDSAQLSSYPFGVSLQNKWPQGKVVRGLMYSLNVPEEIVLVDCSRDPITIAEPDQELRRNIYTFSMNTTNAQDVFDAVRCRMQFKDSDALLGTNLKTVKTFAARAKYEYAVEGSTTIVVEKN